LSPLGPNIGQLLGDDVPSDLGDCRVVELAAGQAEARVLGQGKRKAKLKAKHRRQRARATG
jgi:hypothetical protein